MGVVHIMNLRAHHEFEHNFQKMKNPALGISFSVLGLKIYYIVSGNIQYTIVIIISYTFFFKLDIKFI